jgi:hypothetical protein
MHENDRRSIGRDFMFVRQAGAGSAQGSYQQDKKVTPQRG